MSPIEGLSSGNSKSNKHGNEKNISEKKRKVTFG